MTPSPFPLEIYEIYDISYSHIADPEEDIRHSVIEENLSFHSTHTVSSDSSILNYMQSFPGKAQRAEEKFSSFLSNHVVGVKKSDTLDALEEISYFRSDPFTLIDLELPTNSYGFEIISSSYYTTHKIFRMEDEDDSSLKSQYLYEVSIGLGKESYEDEND